MLKPNRKIKFLMIPKSQIPFEILNLKKEKGKIPNPQSPIPNPKSETQL